MPSGKITSSRLLLLQKAPFPIAIIPDTIFVVWQADINLLVFVSTMALQSSRESYTAFAASTFITSKSEQPENSGDSIFSTASGITILFKEVQPQKALLSISIRPCGKTSPLRFTQPKKAAEPIFLTPLPITIVVNEVQSRNACSPISVTLSGTTIVAKLLQPANAAHPINFTPSDISTFLRFTQHSNALKPISSMVDGITTLINSSLYLKASPTILCVFSGTIPTPSTI